MDADSYLIFSLNSSHYGVEASCVREILPLPELTPITEAPRDIVGVVNLRGEILPVMALNVRLGYRQRDYSLSDSVIVLEWQGFKIGMIVNQVCEVQNISPHEMTTALSYGRETTTHSRAFVAGVAKVGGELVMLLNPENLIRYSEPVQPLSSEKIKDRAGADKEEAREVESLYLEEPVFCPNATPEERAIFRERAENLKRLPEAEDFSGLIPLAIVGLNNEYFGLDLKVVREFTDILKITPVPCCPNHIIGNMNLRGEIVTLVDIRQVLNMPMNRSETPQKAMVIRVDDIVAGLTVDEVFDVMYLHPSQISPVPTAVHSVNDEYLRGTAPYREKMMSIIDVQKMMTKGDLVVNEEV